MYIYIYNMDIYGQYMNIYDYKWYICKYLYQYLSNICKHFWRKFEISQEQSLTWFVSWPRANHVSCTAKGPSWCPKAAGTLWGASRKGPRFSESLTMSYLNGLVEENKRTPQFYAPILWVSWDHWHQKSQCFSEIIGPTGVPKTITNGWKTIHELTFEPQLKPHTHYHILWHGRVLGHVKLSSLKERNASRKSPENLQLRPLGPLPLRCRILQTPTEGCDWCPPHSVLWWHSSARLQIQKDRRLPARKKKEPGGQRSCMKKSAGDFVIPTDPSCRFIFHSSLSKRVQTF